MKRVILLRHAKSDWSDTGLRDFDRPLNGRGERAAAMMGRWARGKNLAFDAIVASPAARVVATLGRFRETFGDSPEPNWDKRIYLASSGTIADVIAETASDRDTLLVAGHSPGLEDFILEHVPDDGSSPLRDDVATKYPTAAMAVLDFGVTDWRDIDRRAALRCFKRPRDLDPSLGPDQR